MSMRRRSYEKQSISQLTADSTFMGGFQNLIAKAKEQRKGNGLGNKRKWTDMSECSSSSNVQKNDNLNESKKIATTSTTSIVPEHNLPQIASIQKEQQALNRQIALQKEQQLGHQTNASTVASSPTQPTMSVSLTPPIPSINNATMSSSNKISTKKQKIETTSVVHKGKLSTKPTKPNTPSPLQQKGATWECHLCTYINTIMHHQIKITPRCAMCNELRDESKEKVSSPSSCSNNMVEIDC